MATNRTYVSEAIRNIYKTNFNKFVNSYRIYEANILFTDDNYKHLTTTEISEKVGFNTYSSFVKAFKKKYKYTPKTYRKKLEEEVLS